MLNNLQKRTLQNKVNRTRLKNILKKTKQDILNKQPVEFHKVQSQIDSFVGFIHKNRASRLVSRLYKMLNGKQETTVL